jgi:hypothetical protein
LQVLASQKRMDATGRTKRGQKALLAFSILLTLGGFVISVIGTRDLWRHVKSITARVAENRPQTGPADEPPSQGAKSVAKTVDEDAHTAVSIPENLSASKTATSVRQVVPFVIGIASDTQQ